MTQTDRHYLSATAAALVAQRGSASERRAATLLDAARQRPAPALSFEGLASLPGWMRAPRAVQADMARRVALVAMGATLARSIDGAWLKALADVAGEEALDWALDAVTTAPDAAAGGTAALPPGRLAASGFGIVAATLPAALRPLLDWADPEPAGVPLAEDKAAAWVGAAQESLA